MKKLFFALIPAFLIICAPACLKAQNFPLAPDSLTVCKGSPLVFMEAGRNKINKLQNKVLPMAGVTDTANITILVSSAKIHHYTEGDSIPPGAEIIPMGNYSVACYRGEPIYRVDHVLSKCMDLVKILNYYGYADNIYYIQFQQNGKNLNTSHFKYATPVGRKADMELKYAD